MFWINVSIFLASSANFSISKTPIQFLSHEELTELMAFENFDDQHAREDDDGNIVKSPNEVDPTLTDVFAKDGSYAHYNLQNEVSDKANWRIKNDTLCLTFTWTDEEGAEDEMGIEGCWVIEKRGNCYMHYYKPLPWERLTYEKDAESYVHYLVKYGERENCLPIFA